MEKCIYKITNLINTKVYIGQTNDFQRRKREHSHMMYNSSCSQNKALYKAIQKYGWNNFSMEIIEDYCENYNEREQYWIQYYQSDKREYGYNGNSGVIDYNKITLSQEQVDNIMEDLKNLSLSLQAIADKYGLSDPQIVSHINLGATHQKEGIQYPIRPTRSELALERAKKIVHTLKTTKLLFKDIANMYDCSLTHVSEVNTGRKFKFPKENYPIRKNTRTCIRFSEEVLQAIYDDIMYTDLTWAQLSKKYHCGEKVFQHINQGKTHKNEQYSYPLRKRKRLPNGAEKAKQIVNLLKTTDWTFTKIAKELNTNTTTIRNINQGKVHTYLNETYPIRK